MRTGVVLEVDLVLDDAADLDLCLDWLDAADDTPSCLGVDCLDVEADLVLDPDWLDWIEDLECVIDEDGGDSDLKKKMF